MLAWLTTAHGLAPADAHLLIGAAAQLDILTLGGNGGADPQSGAAEKAPQGFYRLTTERKCVFL
jgi:hypothetical protein